MNSRRIICSLLLFFGLQAALNGASGFASTTTSNGLVAVIASRVVARGAATEPRVSDALVFKVFTTNDVIGIASLPRDVERLCAIDLLDAQGNAVERTRMGHKVGIPLGKAPRFSTRTTMPFAILPLKQTNTFDMGGSAVLPSPIELFKIKKPGTYRLRVRAQGYVRLNRSQSLVKFGPMEMMIAYDGKDNAGK